MTTRYLSPGFCMSIQPLSWIIWDIYMVHTTTRPPPKHASNDTHTRGHKSNET